MSSISLTAPELVRESIFESSSDESLHGDGDGRPSKRRRFADLDHPNSRPPQQIASRIKSKITSTEASKILRPINHNGKVVDSESSFGSLNLAPWLLASLSALSIQRPTSIQKGCIPAILRGQDVIGGSRTGSGKTIAFAAPILHKWAQDPVGVYAVVLTPTRELALQILEQFKAIASPQSLKAVLIVGGVDMRKQALALASKPHLVVATPGRLADHIRTSGAETVAGLRRAKVVVLDEADRLLADGAGSMLEDVEVCLGALPPSTDRQTCLFTATVTPEVMALKEMPRQKDRPAIFVCEVDTEDLKVPLTLRQTFLQTHVLHRESYLHVLLQTAGNARKNSIIVFCNRTATADLLERLLRSLDHRVTSLHSKLSQRDRTDNLARFRAGAARILVASDVASRGLDIAAVELVINFDVPRNPDDYIHRVGRTARAGRKGEAITFIGQRDVGLFLGIEERISVKMEEWTEAGVNLDTRLEHGGLKEVGEVKRRVELDIEDDRDVMGRRRRGRGKGL